MLARVDLLYFLGGLGMDGSNLVVFKLAVSVIDSLVYILRKECWRATVCR